MASGAIRQRVGLMRATDRRGTSEVGARRVAHGGNRAAASGRGCEDWIRGRHSKTLRRAAAKIPQFITCDGIQPYIFHLTLRHVMQS
jgi:hypothetical protein